VTDRRTVLKGLALLSAAALVRKLPPLIQPLAGQPPSVPVPSPTLEEVLEAVRSEVGDMLAALAAGSFTFASAQVPEIAQRVVTETVKVEDRDALVVHFTLLAEDLAGGDADVCGAFSIGGKELALAIGNDEQLGRLSRWVRFNVMHKIRAMDAYLTEHRLVVQFHDDLLWDPGVEEDVLAHYRQYRAERLA
jgi:hypothetical protein